MDIAGAKALRQRLHSDSEVEPESARADTDVPAGALPVFQWLGVTPPEHRPSIDGDDESAVASAV